MKRTKEEQFFIDKLNKTTKSTFLILGRQLGAILREKHVGAQRLIIETMIDDFERNEKLVKKGE